MEDLALTFPYTSTDLTDQIEKMPNMYGLINALGLFPSEGSISTIIEMHEENGILRVLPAKERGAAPTPAGSRTGRSIFLQCPHFPSEDLITPKDLQDILTVIARTKNPITLEMEIAKRLLDIRNTHAITREWVRASALQGVITDGNGATVYDLYATFGFTKVVEDFNFGNANEDIIGHCSNVFQSIATNLKGETMSRVEAIVDPTWFGKLIKHPNVVKFWLNNGFVMELARMERERLGGQWGRVFEFENILFREYYGSAPIKVNGTLTNTQFWPANTGTAYPVGTQKMFRTWDAPANDIRYVNTPGKEIYVSPKVLDHGAGVELKSESNPLAACRRPEALVQLTSST